MSYDNIVHSHQTDTLHRIVRLAKLKGMVRYLRFVVEYG